MQNNEHITTRFHWAHWAIIALSLLLTLIAWTLSKNQIEEKIQTRFDHQSAQLLDLVKERMSRYEDALRSGVAAIYSQTHGIDGGEWRKFAETIKMHERYPGINGIGVIYQVDKSDRALFLEKIRATNPQFTIHPTHANGELWPITYVEPVESNHKAIGLDMAFENNRWEAAKRARDLNSTQITAPIVLVQDEKKTPGFLQYVPFYSSDELNTLEQRRDHFIGHVYAPFIMHKLIEGTLAKHNRELLFDIYDNDEVLYQELTSLSESYDVNPLLKKQVLLEVYGRQWRFDIHTSLSFRKSVANHQPVYILLGGLAIDALIFLLFVSLTRSNRKALDIAEAITKKLSVSEAYFKQIISAAPCGIYIVDSAGNIESINPSAITQTGYSESEIIGQPIEMIIPERSRSAHVVNRSIFLESKDAQRRMGSGINVHVLRKNGVEFAAEVGLAHFKVSGQSKVLATVVDISRQVEITNELKRSNKELNDFAYVASHDLKAPLRGIIQLSKWIEEDIGQSAPDDTLENLGLLQNRAHRLERLLDDLLAYSRVGRDLGQVQKVNLESLVKSIFELLDPPESMKLNIRGELPNFKTLVIPLDIIFRNLIGNAIKHHHKLDGVITVACVEYPRVYEFSVCDDGPGIPLHLQDKAFEMFSTLKPRDEVEGSGMGLSIVKKMLDYHHCDIKIQSDGKSGTCFVFTWPKPEHVDDHKKGANDMPFSIAGRTGSRLSIE